MTTTSAPTTSDVPNAVAPRKPRWGQRLLLLLVFVGVTAWFAPTIIAWTSLRHLAGRILVPTFRGSTHLGATSLSWQSPITVRDLVIHDQHGQPLLIIGELRSSATLWSILTNSKTYGQFDLDRVVAHVQVDANGSNFDDTIDDIMRLPVVKQPKSLRMVIPAANIEIRQGQAGPAESISDVSITMETDTKFPQGTVAVVSLPGTQPSGGLTALKIPSGEGLRLNSGIALPSNLADRAPRLTLTVRQQPADETPLQLTLAANRWDLQELGPAWQMLAPGMRVRGQLSGLAEWTQAGKWLDVWNATSRLTLDDLEVACVTDWKGDVLTLKSIQATGALGARGDVLQLADCQLASDVGSFKANGTLRLPSFTTAMTTTAAQDVLVLVEDDFRCEGMLDAAAVAQRLPHLLQLRDGVTINTGRLQFKAETGRDNTSRTWTATTRLADLSATAEGQPYRWDAPIEGDLIIRQSDRELVCDKLLVKSEFFQVAGQGTLKSGRFRVTTDLDRLQKELAPLINWDGWTLQGQSRIDGQFVDRGDSRVGLSIQAQCERWAVGAPGNRPWTDAQLTALATADGRWNEHGFWDRLDAADLELKSGSDELTVKLLQPVAPLTASANIPVAIELIGDWSRWLTRAEAIAGSMGVKLAGSGKLTADVTSTADGLIVKSAVLDSAPFEADLPGLRITDPQLQATTAGQLKWSPMVWTAPQTELRGEFGTVVWSNGRYDLSSPAMVPVAGTFTADVDVGRISRWRQGDVRQHALGTGHGTITLQPGTGDQLAGDIDLTIESFVLASYDDAQGRWTAAWREPKLRAAGRGSMALESSAWKIEQGQIVSDGLKVAVAGHGAMPGDRMDVDVRGELAYQWDRLMTRLDPSWSKQFKLSGAGQRPFSMKGSIPMASTTTKAANGAIAANTPMVPGDLTGSVAIGWQQAEAYGLVLGPTDLALQFANGQGQLTPLEIPFAEGRVRLEPRFDLRTSPGFVSLPAGRVVDQLRLSPELCSQWLKYVTPMLGEATEIDGRFSVDLADGAWPMTQPLLGRSAGSISIEPTNVRPGALALRVYEVVEQVRALVQKRAPRTESPERIWMQLPAQKVAFRQEQGRIAHDRFLIRMGDVELATRGSVGIDESLQLIAEVPVKEEWLRDQKYLGQLTGQVLRIPIGGTVRQPQIDTRAIGDLARQAAGGAVEKVLENQVQKQLDRLLPRR